MAQQINLYSPIFLAPKRYFSALAMAQALAVLALLLGAACAWMLASGASLRRDLQSGAAAQAAELQRLTQALAAAQPAASGAALAQELAQVQQTLAQRRALLDELTRGRLAEGHSHAAMLRMVAATVPPAVWLNDIRLVEGRLELKGMTLQPDALRPWLVQLAQHPLTADQQLAAVKVERAAPTLGTAGTAAAAGWAFQLVSQTPRTAVTASILTGTPGARP